MILRRRSSRLFTLPAVTSLLLGSFAALSGAAPAQETIRIDREVGAVKELNLEIGQNRLLVFGEAVARVSVADPKVADLKIITPTQLLLTAHGPGSTDLTLWNRQEQPMVVALRVRRNLEGLRRQVSELFPGENIKVSGEGELIVLSGETSDIRVPERVVEVAKLHSDKIVNLLTVSGNQQVQLEVKFAEVSRTGLRSMGFNLFHMDQAGNRVGGLVGPPASILAQPLQIPGTSASGPPPVFAPPKGNAFTLFFSSFPNFPFSVAVSLLESNGLAKILAEPTLVALSGQEAKFLAGGEFPIPMSTGFGNVSVQWKQFGIILEFVPTVLGQDTIQLRLMSEVSDVDPSRQVTIGGFTVPALSTRKSETTVRLNDGQSFAIAGLLSNNIRSQIDKVPLLGDIPILGALFRSVEYRRSESELLVVVTSRLTRPLAPHEVQPLPTDNELNDPNDFALFLLGLEGRGAPDAAEKRGSGRGASPGIGEGARDGAGKPQSLERASPGRATAIRSRRGPAGEIGFVR